MTSDDLPLTYPKGSVRLERYRYGEKIVSVRTWDAQPPPQRGDLIAYEGRTYRVTRFEPHPTNQGPWSANVEPLSVTISPPGREPKVGDIVDSDDGRYRVVSCTPDSNHEGWWRTEWVPVDKKVGGVCCTCCGSDTNTKTYPYRTDMASPEKVIGREMPLDDPRTHHLCFVCATTHISESNRSMFKSENRIMGQITNILLDAIASGKDPRENYGDP